jgi:hypothetical protein
LAFTHADDVIVDDVGDGTSDLYLRDPGTTRDWRISGGYGGGFVLFEPDGASRLWFYDGAAGDSYLTGRDNIIAPNNIVAPNNFYDVDFPWR